MDVSDTTVRLSMGLEDVNDLYEDIVQELGQEVYIRNLLLLKNSYEIRF